MLKLLIVNNNWDDIYLVKLLLKRAGINFMIKPAFDKSEYELAISTGSYDVVITDEYMIHFSASEVISMLKSMNIVIPTLVLFDTFQHHLLSSATGTGVFAFINKDNLKQLVPALETRIYFAQLEKNHPGFHQGGKKN